MTLTRRRFLTRSALLGCSAAASPLITPMAFASAPWDNRLVVIILRGGMDGLAVVRPYGDPDFAGLRGDYAPGATEGPADLDGYFALHPSLRPLMPMWQAGHLGFVHAVSTPYRDKRSHFDGQDLLEAGTGSLGDGRDGWLNRLLQTVPGAEAETAYAIGRDTMAVLSGPAPVSSWAPDSDLALSPQAMRLAELVMSEDPAFAAALAQAYDLAGSDGDAVETAPEMMGGMSENMIRTQASGTEGMARFAAERLRGDARIAAFSLNGWDTHNMQARGLARALGTLSQTLLTLQDGLGGPVWKKTTVIAMTEFGRTARINGTGGTDHGTAGAMVMAGGALRGGRVIADWPGLAQADLYQNRDLRPTRDMRAHAAWVMRGLFGLDRATLERKVFPDLDMGADPGLLL